MIAGFEQGEFIKLDFGTSIGYESIGRNLALVVSSSRFNAAISGFAVICPIITQDNKHPLHVRLKGEVDAEGFVCVEQLRTVDLVRWNAESLYAFISQKTMSEVLEIIGAVFGI
ncbi:MAG: type II toxin-antitoxin system PemK/MazF family toxin [Coriobacteriia bacterium]|nr:type II toxin-antitoxin system PemK/MazF family toxin [Coriobacteriia bacterium]